MSERSRALAHDPDYTARVEPPTHAQAEPPHPPVAASGQIAATHTAASHPAASQTAASQTGQRTATRVIRSSELLGAGGVVGIEHNGAVYTLRRTRHGRLILTK